MLTREQIQADILGFLKENFPNPSGGDLTYKTRLLDEWFIDSLAVIEVALYLEKQFGVDLSGSDVNAENFENIASLSQFIFDRLRRAPR